MYNKLIHLLKTAKYPVFEGFPPEVSLGVQHSEVAFDAICKHLLSNNTIILPCKVGDTVYVPWEYNDSQGIATAEVDEIKIDKNNLISFHIDLESDCEDFNETFGGWLPASCIGKSVFLNEKDARTVAGGV